MAKKVRFGIIGSAGLIGNYHSGILMKGKGPYALTALCDADAERLKLQSDAWGIPGFTNVREFLKKGEMDAVIVATPHPTHAENGIAVVRSGRALMCEKPIAQTVGQARKLLAEVKKHRQIAVVHYQQRGNPTYIKARQLITDGKLGRLLLIRSTGSYYKSDYYYTLGGWRGLWDLEGGATCINQAPHDIDLMCWLAGGAAPAEMSARWANAYHTTMQAEDSATAFGRFPNGCEFSLQVNVATHGDPNRHEIFGSAGALTIQGGAFTRYIRYAEDLVKFCKSYPGTNPYAGPKIKDMPLPKAPGHDPSIIHKRFAQAVLSGDRSKLISPLEEGMWSLETINGVYLSHHLGQKITMPIAPARYEKMLKTLIAKTPKPRRKTQKSVIGFTAVTDSRLHGEKAKKSRKK